MLVTIIKKELVTAFRSRQLLLLFFLYILLLALALVLNYKCYNQLQDQRQQAQEAAYKTWLGQGYKNAHTASHFGTYAYKPVSALGFVDPGLNNFTGTQVKLEAHKQNDVLFSASDDANADTRLGALTIALVLQLFVPLFISFLAFASISKEKEDRTLPLLLAQGISLRQLLWGKIAAYSLITLLLLLPVFSVCPLLLNGHASLWRLAGMFSAYFLYYFFVVALVVVVSSFAPTSKTALLCLLSFWVLSSVLIPKASANLGSDLFPLATKLQFQSAVEEDTKNGLDGHNPDSVRLKILQQKVLSQYGMDSVSQLPVNLDGILMQADEEYHDTVYDKHFGDVQTTMRKQNKVSQWASLMNPWIALRNLSMGFAGTDYEHFANFQLSSETYRRQMMKMMNDYLTKHSKTGDYTSEAPPSFWHEVSPFRYQAPSVKWVLQKHIVELSVLLFWTLAVILLVNGAARRMTIL